MTSSAASALIIGASGIVGSITARFLRRLHPELHISIGGRDMDKAAALARSIGNASPVVVDLDRPGLGMDSGAYSVMAVHVKDTQLHALRFAQEHRIPYIGISSGAFEIAPELAQFTQRPDRIPLVMGSQWLAGAATLPALHFARDFAAIDAIRIDALLDEQDMGGPAAYADYDRITAGSPSMPVLENGHWRWVRADREGSRFGSVDGVMMEAKPYSPLDIMSLAAATDARSVRLDLAVGESASRRRGEPYSTEIIITLTGTARNGDALSSRHEIVHPEGQAPLTALGVALMMERLAGLKGDPPAAGTPAAGLYLPNSLVEPSYMVERMQQFGAVIRRAA